MTINHIYFDKWQLSKTHTVSISNLYAASPWQKQISRVAWGLGRMAFQQHARYAENQLKTLQAVSIHSSLLRLPTN